MEASSAARNVPNRINNVKASYCTHIHHLPSLSSEGDHHLVTQLFPVYILHIPTFMIPVSKSFILVRQNIIHKRTTYLIYYIVGEIAFFCQIETILL